MKLFIIGNGFDLFTGYHTSYLDFKNFLIEHEYEYLISEQTLLDILSAEENYNFWKDFEESLASISLSRISYGYNADADIYENHHIIEHMRNINEELYDLIGKAFSDFIAEKTINSLSPKELYSSLFSADDRFITFNYSPTLELVYGVNQYRILYLHGMCIPFRDDEEDFRSPIVFGHSGEIPSELYDRNLYYEDDNPEYIKSRIREGLRKQLDIYRFEEFIGSVYEYEEIHIIGHSLGKVDKPYFQKLNVINSPKIIYWEYIATSINYDESISKIQELFPLVSCTIYFYNETGILSTTSVP